jgi:tetratricopeptide (TPR) repeat protein
MTSRRNACRVLVRSGCRVIWESAFDGTPSAHFEGRFNLPDSVAEDTLSVEVADRTGKQLVAWQPEPVTVDELPAPAQAITRPEELDSIESLYLAGVHLEQYRHATRMAEDYYREALHRDAGDARCNNALGRIYLRRGKPAQAESHFRAAIARLTRHNPNPYDGEPYYNLGLALVMQSQWEAAYEAFGKATWNAAWQDVAWFQMARLETRRGNRDAARKFLDACLARNGRHQQAIHLRFALRAQDKDGREALMSACSEHQRDPLNVGLLYEMNHCEQSEAVEIPVDFLARANSSTHTFLDLAFDYAAAGLYARAVGVLDYCLEKEIPGWDLPLIHYCRAVYQRALGQCDKAAESASVAARWSPDCCFPGRIELIPILQAAMEHAPTDPRAPYYLGNLWYHHRQYDDAIACWERARDLDPRFATVWRNLGLAYYNQRHDRAAARDAYLRAFAADPKDARVLYELDQLERRLGESAEPRLARLRQHFSLVLVRDDLYLEYVTLLNQLDRHQEALDHILQRRFHPWEGGEGKVPAQFVLAITQLARQELAARRYDKCLSLLRRTEVWPASLGEGKLPGIQENNIENNIQYWRGCALRGLGELVTANESFRQAAVGLSEPSSPMFYNDQPPDMIFYQGLALRALGQCDAAHLRFTRLIEYGQEHLPDRPEIDFFAVSLPDFLVFDDDLQRRNEVHCRYMMGLGYLGLEQHSEAREQFTRVLALDAHHQGALIHQSWSAESQL